MARFGNRLDEPRPARDAFDDAAIRSKIGLRRALVDEGDYFAFLGVDREATGYQIRHAYLDLRREFEPSTLLTAATAELREDVEVILEVLDEAFEVLRDAARPVPQSARGRSALIFDCCRFFELTARERGSIRGGGPDAHHSLGTARNQISLLFGMAVPVTRSILIEVLHAAIRSALPIP